MSITKGDTNRSDVRRLCVLASLFLFCQFMAGWNVALEKTSTSAKRPLPERNSRPPELKRAILPVPPIATTQSGLVLLDLTLDADGGVSRVRTLRGEQPFLRQALEAARQWTFESSQTHDPTRVSAFFFFQSPQLVSFQNIQSDYRQEGSPELDCPALPRSISSPTYPHNSVAQGAIVIQALIGTQGAVESTSIIHDLPSLGRSICETVRSWKFYPARVGGNRCKGTAVIVASFVRPVILDRMPSISP